MDQIIFGFWGKLAKTDWHYPISILLKKFNLNVNKNLKKILALRVWKTQKIWKGMIRGRKKQSGNPLVTGEWHKGAPQSENLILTKKKTQF